MILRFVLVFTVVMTFAVATPALADDAPAPVAAEASADCSATPDGETLARSCQRCGDGYCAKSCGENEDTCPKDCGTVDM